SGQKRSLRGGLQPRVTPALVSAAMSAAKTLPAVSVKRPDAGLRSNARTRKAAIWPRVTGWSGQNWVLAGGSQPFVMPVAASQAVSAGSAAATASRRGAFWRRARDPAAAAGENGQAAPPPRSPSLADAPPAGTDGDVSR